MAWEDRAALVALFRSTGGTRWTKSNNWNTGADLSQWHGVEVNSEGRVVKLLLEKNNLKGILFQEGPVREQVLLFYDVLGLPPEFVDQQFSVRSKQSNLFWQAYAPPVCAQPSAEYGQEVD